MSSKKELEDNKSFKKTKIQFERDVLRYFYRKDQTSPQVQGELYLLLKEMEKFFTNAVIEKENEFFNAGIADTPIYLVDYKKKIFFDPEANWIYVDDMNASDLRAKIDGFGMKVFDKEKKEDV